MADRRTTGDEPTAELDRAELAQSHQALAAAAPTGTDPRRPRRHTRVDWAARSDIGRARENNEDKFDFYLPDDPATLATKGRLWAVADGMGGHNAGQVASEAALKTVVRAYFGGDTGENGDLAEVTDSLGVALTRANALIWQAAARFPEKAGMGTTATVAVIHEDVLTVGHVGDSRAYLLRDGSLRQLTSDHSWVEEQVRRGALSRTDALRSPYRNMITRSIGAGEALEPEVVSETLRAGDVVLLCTDGLTGYLEGDALKAHLATAAPSAAALSLIEAANEAGGRDNITALVVAVRAVEDYPSS
jgi:protein phosphatase